VILILVAWLYRSIAKIEFISDRVYNKILVMTSMKYIHSKGG